MRYGHLARTIKALLPPVATNLLLRMGLAGIDSNTGTSPGLLPKLIAQDMTQAQ